MVTAEWNAWVKHHAAMFGLMSDQDTIMFEAWRDVFGKAGFLVEELQEATAHIAITNPPRWRSEHLAAITARIMDRRRAAIQAAQRQAAAEYDRNQQHGQCGGTGWVHVPHLSCVKDGEWLAPWYTVVVLCDCSRGERIRAGHAESKMKDGEMREPALGIAAYTNHNPDWHGQMRRRREVLAAHLRAQEVTAVTDKKGGVLRGIMRAIGIDAKPAPRDKRSGAEILKQQQTECPF